MRALAWLLFLAPFFYLTYGGANWLAAQHDHVPSVVFDWEHLIPFIAWTIIPYWSINAFYGLSFFVCTSKAELDTHGLRLLTAQIIAVTCFILVPLRFTFTQPATSGVPGFLFDALTSFDKPFSQAPSLHIALFVILWSLFSRHVPRWSLWLLNAWFLLVAVSVLTTYQHHFKVHLLMSPSRTMRSDGVLLCATRWEDWCLASPGFWRAALRCSCSGLSLALVATNYAFFGAEAFRSVKTDERGFAAPGRALPCRRLGKLARLDAVASGLGGDCRWSGTRAHPLAQ